MEEKEWTTGREKKNEKGEGIRRPKLEPCREKISPTLSSLPATPSPNELFLLRCSRNLYTFTRTSIIWMWKFLFIHLVGLFVCKMFTRSTSITKARRKGTWREQTELCRDLSVSDEISCTS